MSQGTAWGGEAEREVQVCVGCGRVGVGAGGCDGAGCQGCVWPAVRVGVRWVSVMGGVRRLETGVYV